MQLGFAFVQHFEIFLITSILRYVICFFDVITFINDVRIMLYLDIFEVCMEVTLKLRLVFARHCDIFSLHYNYVIYLFNIVTFFDSVRIRLYFSMFELRTEIAL